MGSNKTIQFILNQHYPAYAEAHKQPLRVIKAIEPQMQCRTRELGSSHFICPEDGEHVEFFHSCRNKGCTVCNQQKQSRWLERQDERLLNCGHFHLVFTLPSEYHALWLYNREWFIKNQFEVSSETLKNLLEGNTHKGKHYEGRLNAMTGFISTLHTWGRALNLHPHIHILITAGGLDRAGAWTSVDSDYLVPVKQMKKLYRGKFQSRIKAFINSDSIILPPNESRESLLLIGKGLFQKEWSVHLQKKYDQGKGVLIYLSRYLGSQPIKPEQLTLINHNREVLFSYWSHRENKRKRMRLTLDAFLKKYLLHQAQPAIHTVRYYGLYASQATSKHDACTTLLGKTERQKNPLTTALFQTPHELLCPCCGARMLLSYVTFRQSTLKNPFYKKELQIKGCIEMKVPPGSGELSRLPP